jgi:hypothetical protein
MNMPGTSRILRHCNVSIDGTHIRLDENQPSVSAALDLPRIHELKGISCYLSHFTRPSLAKLTRIQGAIVLDSKEFLSAMEALITYAPGVENLSFDCYGAASRDLFAPLANLTCLKTLSLNYPDHSFTPSVLDACTSLRELTLCFAPRTILSSLLHSSGAQRLECITLEHFWYESVDWQVDNLVSLRRLELRQGADGFIKALSLKPTGVPALETLILYPSVHEKRCCASREAFETVVRRHTRVSFHLVYGKGGFASVSRFVRHVYESVAIAYPHRITVH